MNTNGDDRRVRKTKKALARALVELMYEKDIEKISVRELCDKADVHRATFYSHYSSVFELYERLENYVADEIRNTMATYQYEKYPQFLKRMLDFVYSNAETFNLVMNSGKSKRFYDEVLDILLIGYFKTWDENADLSDYSTECIYMAKYHLQGYMKLVAEWIKDGFVLTEDEIIKLIIDIGSGFDALMDEYIANLSKL